MKKIGIVRFLGTNCDRDIWQAVEMAGHKPFWLWFRDKNSELKFDEIIIPGGFSYGDYLRAGALSARAPIMEFVKDQAKKGVPILGICNGFQVLCESGLLPGALVKNESQRFIDSWVQLNVHQTCYWQKNRDNSAKKLPVAHGEGRFVISDDGLKALQDGNQILYSYKSNPNGSTESIAGVSDKSGNICGLMPHPERAVAPWMGGIDGQEWFL